MDELHILQTLAGGLLTSQRQQTLRDVDAEHAAVRPGRPRGR